MAFERDDDSEVVMVEPALRELRDGKVILTPEEEHALKTEGMMVCTPKFMAAVSARYWKARNAPGDFEGTCDRCGEPIVFRPWAAIAKSKICISCYMREKDSGKA